MKAMKAMQRVIRIENARSHNLQGIDCEIPLGQLTVITGPSGSGKTSLAFDTLYAEGQRRYVSSLSAYARQFLERLPRPEVDHISNLPPAIAIEQRNGVSNARATVGSATETDGVGSVMDPVRLGSATPLPLPHAVSSTGVESRTTVRAPARTRDGRLWP